MMKNVLPLFFKGTAAGLTVFALLLVLMCQSCSVEKVQYAKNGTIRTRGHHFNAKKAKEYNRIQYTAATYNQ